MIYLLDTNILMALLHPERRRLVLPRIEAQAPGEVVTSAVVAHELFYGAAKSARPEENRRRFARLLADLEPLPFTQADAEAAGEVRAILRAKGRPIGPYDVLIAGQARARGLVLVTNNGREFERVDGLKVEDWLQ